MAKETINIGAVADDGTGDSIRISGTKINSNFTEIYDSPKLILSHIDFDNNTIKGLLSNADIELSGNGTGTVAISDLTIDSTINLSDNEIKVNTSNADLELTASGTGSIQFTKVDINGGVIDDTVIGGATATTGTFTTLTTNTSAVLDGVTITDNIISTNASNANLELLGNGTGYVSINGVNFPSADGTSEQVLQTNGNGQLSWYTSPIILSNSDILDGTATITGNSATQTVDSFSLSTYRSMKYTIQVSDPTDNRYRLIEANITHDGSNAYISLTGAVDNGNNDGSTAYDSLDFSADINSGNVRLLGIVNNDNSQVLKFVRRPLKV